MIRIRNDFKNLIPPLSKEEFDQLEQNCIAEGIRDPLVLWGDVLIDGHNRYAIAQKHGLTFDIVQREFKSDDEAMAWIARNQIGRRNLSSYDRSLLALKMKPKIAEKAKERMLDGAKGVQISAQAKTRDTLATIAGVSHDTIHKVEVINEKATPRTKQLLREGKLSINQAYNSVRSKRLDPVKRAKEEHEQFEKEKAGGVVDLVSARKDKTNTDILDLNLYKDVLKLFNAIDAFKITYEMYDLTHLEKVIEEDERPLLLQRCQACLSTLIKIKYSIGG